MSESRVILSVDFGTSSVKGLCIARDGQRKKYKAVYDGNNAESFYQAFCYMVNDVLKDFKKEEICAIGMTSQAGTYILAQDNGTNITYPWNMTGGEPYVEQVDEMFTREEFLNYTSVYSPKASSYPVPRALQLQAQQPNEWVKTQKYLQPKDYIYHRLTGMYYTDKYLWRGMANLQKEKFEEDFLQRIGLNLGIMPEMKSSFCAPASVNEAAAAEVGLKEGTPVFLGCNDYFASLMGMGITKIGDVFDITGTSEHVGCLAHEIQTTPELISGPYFDNYVHYGVTASSGRSIAWGSRVFDMKLCDVSKMIENNAPLFLPYVGGERAPIWNSEARGVFLGIDEKHGDYEMSYAIFEGVVFSLYHIWTYLHQEGDAAVRVSGGGAENTVLNRMKATMFERDMEVVQEIDTSALGAAMCAAIGNGWFESLEHAAAEWITVKDTVSPDPALRILLMRRFEKYISLLNAVKPLWK